MTTETPPAESLAWPPHPAPERAAYIRQAAIGTLAALVDSMLADLAGSADSTAGLSLTDRTMVRIVRPYVPRMRGLILERLGSVDPAVIERTFGAVATAIEQVLAEAPGEPLDRWRLVWYEGERAPRLVPDRWSRSPGDTDELGVSTPTSSSGGDG